MVYQSENQINMTEFQDVQNLKLDKLIEFCIVLHDNNQISRYKEIRDSTLNALRKLEIIEMVHNDDYKIQIRFHNHRYQLNYICKAGSDVFKQYHNFLNRYHQYVKKIHFVDEHLIDTIIDNDCTWFNLYQISDLLCYAKSSYLASYYIPRFNLQSRRINGQIYTDNVGLQEILKRGRKPGCKRFMEQLDLQVNEKIQSHEANILEDVIEFLKIHDTCYNLQHLCGQYRIDMYIPKYNIAIEIDEMGHQDRNKIYEQNREQYIKNTLNATFLRINPNVDNFRIAKELGNLSRLMK
jgi:very-short-patch-repair endonuclease